MLKPFCKICQLKRVSKFGKRYCSLECYHRDPEVSKAKSLTLSKQWLTLTCKTCSSVFKVSPCYTGRLFCSRKCITMGSKGNEKRSISMEKARKDPSWKGTPHSAEEKLKISRAQKKMCEDPKVIEQKRAAGIASTLAQAGRTSKFELGIKSILEEALGKDQVVHQFKHALGIADFYIPKYNLVIFADGQYWHNLPGAKEKDTKQTDYLKRQGHSVWRISDGAEGVTELQKLLGKLLKATTV